ncbi:MFS general substrate transporter [Trichodelitschia bisporula]|uniref:MFS general substrate transporter n=1 Tax=Trichodelitschia bisporula TaxID=703511 RepID=A0A6G1HJP9_9PEZI|nr:MFS general substrate transporter [Trichodelitschia bisporula]
MIRYLYKKHQAKKREKAGEPPKPAKLCHHRGAPLADAEPAAAKIGLLPSDQEPTDPPADPPTSGQHPLNHPLASPKTNDDPAEKLAKLGHQPSGKELDKEPQSTITEPCLECKAEQRRRNIYLLKLIVALFPSQFLQSVDTTIVATALTTVASRFDHLDELTWIVLAYSLPATAFIPWYGQLADVFGRHAALQLSMAFMLIGSTLCAAAQTWGMLLFGRALQGLSAAGIANLVKIVLSDKVTLAEQSRNNSIFALVTGVGYSVGPIVGGSLAVANWRYCFVLSIPIAALAMVLIFFVLREELVHGTHHLTGPERVSLRQGLATIDVGGTTLFVLGAGLVILATSWGGTKYDWDSYRVVLPLVLGSVLFVSFFVYEYLLEPGHWLARRFPRQVAMIPFKLFQRKDVALLAVINAATGAALYCAFYFVGIFWTLAQDYSPSKAGLQLLYYTPGLGVGAYSAMFICNVWPRQTFYPLMLGSTVEALGFALLTWATSTRKSALVNVTIAIAGAGTGLRFMPNTLHAVGVWPTEIAAVMSLMDFALPFGGTLSLAIMASVFSNKFSSSLAHVDLGPGGRQNADGLDAIRALPDAVQLAVRQRAAHAVMWAFASALPLMGLSVLAACFLGNVWINPAKEGARHRGYVVYGVYLKELARASFTDSFSTFANVHAGPPQNRPPADRRSLDLRVLNIHDRNTHDVALLPALVRHTRVLVVIVERLQAPLLPLLQRLDAQRVVKARRHARDVLHVALNISVPMPRPLAAHPRHRRRATHPARPSPAVRGHRVADLLPVDREREVRTPVVQMPAGAQDIAIQIRSPGVLDAKVARLLRRRDLAGPALRRVEPYRLHIAYVLRAAGDVVVRERHVHRPIIHILIHQIDDKRELIRRIQVVPEHLILNPRRIERRRTALIPA